VCGGLLALLLGGLQSSTIRPAVAAGEAEATGTLAAIELRVNDKPSPVGVDAVPHFGWRASDETRDALQAGYRIQVAASREALERGEELVWDSGRVRSNLVNAVPYGGPPLESDTRYYWRVRLSDDLGREGPPSAVAAFDVGLLTNEDWSGASWIRRDSREEDDYTLYRRRFELSAGAIQRAVLYISSCHKYELWVNGVPTGKGPAYHQPQYQYYNAYDVAVLLRPGSPNVLAVFNHWWGFGQGRPRAERGVIARLVVTHADGRRTVVGSDGEWRQRRAEQWELGTAKRNRTNGIGYIEKIHAARVVEGWQEVGFDDSGWEAVSVVGAHPVAPWTGVLQADLTRVIEARHQPVAWTQLDESHFVVDFGKVRAGYPVVDFPAGGAAGEVALRGGYTQEDDGRVSRRTTQRTDLGYTYVYDGRGSQFRPAPGHALPGDRERAPGAGS
jgi:alpha-L-rhamnosidase